MSQQPSMSESLVMRKHRFVNRDTEPSIRVVPEEARSTESPSEPTSKPRMRKTAARQGAPAGPRRVERWVTRTVRIRESTVRALDKAHHMETLKAKDGHPDVVYKVQEIADRGIRQVLETLGYSPDQADQQKDSR